MDTIIGEPALVEADSRWGFARVLTGRGLGRHPYTSKPAPGTMGVLIGMDGEPVCGRCRRDRSNPVHQAPKRRRCAAFGIFATHGRQGGHADAGLHAGTPDARLTE